MILEICVGLLFVSVAFACCLFIQVARLLNNKILQLSEEYTKHDKLLKSSNTELHSVLFEIDCIYAELNKLDECSNGHALKCKLKERLIILTEKYNKLRIIIKCENVATKEDKYDMFIIVVYSGCMCYKSYTSYDCAKTWPIYMQGCKFSQYMIQDNCNQWLILPEILFYEDNKKQK